MTAAGSTVTVIICAFTQARWADMERAVESARSQPDTSEVLLVIDHEPALLERSRARWSDIRVIGNRYRQGLSGARNTALEVATGEIVAFLDDDASAESDWLAHLLDGFEDHRVVAVGGTAQPRWPAGTPARTLPPELLWIVGCTYVGQPTTRSDVRNVVGCSMAFRRVELMQVGGFNLNTGRVGSIPLGAEETETCIRLRQADPSRRVVFEPLSRVQHTVTPERMTWRYLRRRSFFEGVSKAALSRDLGAGDALASERSYSTRVLPAGFFRSLAHGRLPEAAAIVLCLGATTAGYAYGLVRGRTVEASIPAPLVPRTEPSSLGSDA